MPALTEVLNARKNARFVLSVLAADGSHGVARGVLSYSPPTVSDNVGPFPRIIRRSESMVSAPPHLDFQLSDAAGAQSTAKLRVSVWKSFPLRPSTGATLHFLEPWNVKVQLELRDEAGVLVGVGQFPNGQAASYSLTFPLIIDIR